MGAKRPLGSLIRSSSSQSTFHSRRQAQIKGNQGLWKNAFGRCSSPRKSASLTAQLARTRNLPKKPLSCFFCRQSSLLFWTDSAKPAKASKKAKSIFSFHFGTWKCGSSARFPKTLHWLMTSSLVFTTGELSKKGTTLQLVGIQEQGSIGWSTMTKYSSSETWLD